MKKIVKCFLIAIEVSVLFIAVGALCTAITKNIYAEALISQFKKRGVLDEAHSTNRVKYYPIDANEERPTIQNYGGTYYPGNTGDILISLTSELEIPFVQDFISFFAGGHAAIVLGDYQDATSSVTVDQTMESTGIGDDAIAGVSDKGDYWVDVSPYDEVLCLRVNTTEEQRKRVIADAMAFDGDPYNYAFIWDTKKKTYCSDLINKIYSKLGFNLNKDGFTTSVYDLVVSNETYLSYYHYVDYDGVRHVYYLR